MIPAKIIKPAEKPAPKGVAIDVKHFYCIQLDIMWHSIGLSCNIHHPL